MEPINTYLSRPMKIHVSLQQENVFIRTPFAAAGSLQSKNSPSPENKGRSLKNNLVIIASAIPDKSIQTEM